MLNSFRVIPVLLIFALAAGCVVGARMQQPADLAAGGDVLEVDDRSRFGAGLLTSAEFNLGPYRVSDVDRAWTRTRSSAEDLYFFDGRELETRSSGGFSFSLSSEEDSLSASCNTVTLGQAYDFGDWSVGDNSQAMSCVCQGTQGVVSSFWVVDASAGTQWAGTLRPGDLEYAIVGDKRLEGNKTSPTVAGYRFEDEGSVLGAVDITYPGRLWLQQRVPATQRAAVGCAAAAILLEPYPPNFP